MLALKPASWVLLSLSLVLIVALYPVVNSGVICAKYQKKYPYSHDATLSMVGQEIRLEKASTAAEREQGLSGRACMHHNQGMLFVFDESDRADHCFWMEGMRFPLDMVWLNAEKRVVFSASDLSPSSYPTKYCPVVPTRYVLELGGGVARNLGLRYDAIALF